MNILQTMNDPSLFASDFEGESWSAWRVLLRSLFGLEIDAGEGLPGSARGDGAVQ